MMNIMATENDSTMILHTTTNDDKNRLWFSEWSSVMCVLLAFINLNIYGLTCCCWKPETEATEWNSAVHYHLVYNHLAPP